VQFYFAPPPCGRGVPERPRATPLARAQVARGGSVATLHHTVAELGAAERQVLACCDGTRTHAGLANELGLSAPEVERALARLQAGALLLA